LCVKAEIVWDAKAKLGEGPIWMPSEQAVWFVDIKQGRLHRFTPATGAGETFEVGGRPSFVVATDRGGLLVGSGHALIRYEGGRAVETVATIDMPPRNRTNDATVDGQGRLWFGTMDDDEQHPHGRVYRFDGTIREMGGECCITNGPAVSPDGRFLYHVDTIAGLIWRFPLDGERLADGEVLTRIDPADGHPDGVNVDAEGCIWVALWGGWGVRRYSPEGELLATIAFPCAQVTKVTFGGPDLRTVYATTASIGLSPEELERQPLAGGLFAFEAPAPGLPPHSVRLG
jgi:sugar lactone lactonase YvrE